MRKILEKLLKDMIVVTSRLMTHKKHGDHLNFRAVLLLKLLQTFQKSIEIETKEEFQKKGNFQASSSALATPNERAT